MYGAVLFSGVLLFGAEKRGYAKKITILKEPYQTLFWVLNDIFPPIKDKLDIKKINTIGFFMAIMDDKRVEDDEKIFIKKGIERLSASSIELYKKQYISLNFLERDDILKTISKENWGENWLWTLLKYTLESLLCDPVYGGNIDQVGWKWLGHTTGHPRPKAL
ncbi:MAG: gluconate 2-dehydrogenase gamma chain [Campylobacterota bacterium]|nr:gluconate 2-dehydrogenase gamma chain [Campylobacterota bacterium]